MSKNLVDYEMSDDENGNPVPFDKEVRASSMKDVLKHLSSIDSLDITTLVDMGCSEGTVTEFIISNLKSVEGLVAVDRHSESLAKTLERVELAHPNVVTTTFASDMIEFAANMKTHMGEVTGFWRDESRLLALLNCTGYFTRTELVDILDNSLPSVDAVILNFMIASQPDSVSIGSGNLIAVDKILNKYTWDFGFDEPFSIYTHSFADLMGSIERAGFNLSMISVYTDFKKEAFLLAVRNKNSPRSNNHE